MKIKISQIILISLVFTSGLLAQSTASALFLMVSPGARAAGMGEAQVAVANDSYASYWNPAGMAFQKGYEASLMHVQWLPGLADDMYYDFVGGRVPYKDVGVFGGHIIYLNAGEQIWTNAQNEVLGSFYTYFTAAAGSFATMLSEKSAIGLNLKIVYQHLADPDIYIGTEKTNPTATSYAFDVGYLKKDIFNRIDFGLMISNIGPKVIFNDEAQADPMPTNFKAGLNVAVIKDTYNKLNITYDINKMLVASYPAMDWDNDGFVGGYDEEKRSYIINGSVDKGDFNSDGQKEIAHTDSWYAALITSWLDDWYLGGNRDLDGNHIIGGYTVVGDSTVATTGIGYGEAGYGAYNELGKKEVGNKDDYTFTNELESIVHNVGIEYWYNDIFAVRGGFYYDQLGKISAPTYGLGLRYANYGFDFGYTDGKEGHPLTNTMRFSLTIAFD